MDKLREHEDVEPYSKADAEAEWDEWQKQAIMDDKAQQEKTMKGKDIWLLIILTWIAVSAIVQLFNANLGATLFVYITLTLAVIGFVYLWRD